MLRNAGNIKRTWVLRSAGLLGAVAEALLRLLVSKRATLETTEQQKLSELPTGNLGRRQGAETSNRSCACYPQGI